MFSQLQALLAASPLPPQQPQPRPPSPQVPLGYSTPRTPLSQVLHLQILPGCTPPPGIVLWVCLAYWEISLEPGIFLAEAKVTGILKPFHE